MSNVKYVVAFRQNRKRFLVKIKGGKCCNCGFDSFNEALEFHHVDPDDKKYTISQNCHSLKDDISEVRKCALLCANCHRGIHANIIELPKNWNYINEKLISKTLSHKKENRCKICGKEIGLEANYCRSCSYIKSRKVDRPNREELKELIRNNSFVKIGKLYSVSDNAIKKWCKSYNLPSKKIDIEKISNTEWEKL